MTAMAASQLKGKICITVARIVMPNRCVVEAECTMASEVEEGNEVGSAEITKVHRQVVCQA